MFRVAFFSRSTFKTFVLSICVTIATSMSIVAQSTETLSIVATTSMIADAAKEVGGDLVKVRALMGAGVDPHAYRQTRSDIVDMTKADLVLWNGHYLEAQMEEFLLGLTKENNVVAVAEAIPSNLLLGSEDYKGRNDPHIWMNVNLWSRVVVAVRDALVAVDTDNADIYRTNANAYLRQLSELANYVVGVLSTVPPESRVVVSAHDAFNYFGSAYGFEPVGIQGVSTESEAGLKRVGEMVDMLVSRNIGAVFVETSVSDRNMKALIEGAKARGHKVMVGGELFSDAMGEPGTYRGTYIGMLDSNATTIANALGGKAPKGGMKGLLQ